MHFFRFSNCNLKSFKIKHELLYLFILMFITLSSCFPLNEMEFCDCKVLNHAQNENISSILPLNPYPWVVSIGMKLIPIQKYNKDKSETSSIHHCTGVVLNEKYVLTTARCISNLNVLKDYIVHFDVGYGNNLEEMEKNGRIPIKIVHVNPFFKKEINFRNLADLAIVRLQRPLPFEDGEVAPACFGITNSYTVFESKVLGFGDRHLNYNSKLELKRIAVDRVNNTVSAAIDIFSENFLIKARKSFNDSFHLTAGDEGGPLQEKYEGLSIVTGITSFLSIQMNEEIHRINEETDYFFVDLNLYFPWIKSIVGKKYCNKL